MQRPALPKVVIWDRTETNSAALADVLRPFCGGCLALVERYDFVRKLLDPEPKVDLVITDFETLLTLPEKEIERLRSSGSGVKLAVATDLRPEEYISEVRALRIYHVLVKSPPFNRHELGVFLDCAVNPRQGFGLAHHFWHTLEMHSLTVSSRKGKNDVVERVINHFATNGFEIHELYDVRLILEELINNAFFHAFRTAEGKEKYHLTNFEGLTTEESVRVDYGNAGGVVGFAVTDNAGTLHPDTILCRLERQYKRHGILDESGRGLYISRMLASSLLFNIHEGHRTQIVATFREKDRRQRLKPLIVNFIGASDRGANGEESGSSRQGKAVRSPCPPAAPSEQALESE